mgnify:CR=1 FL=1
MGRKMLARIVLILLLLCPSCAFPSENVKQECSIKSQTREIKGMHVFRDCWQYKYRKDCSKQSKNDCQKIDHSICALMENECANKSMFGKTEICTNYKQHFACEKTIAYQEEHQELVQNDRKLSEDELMCGYMCLDGNCDQVRKASDDQNHEIATASAMLHGLKEAKKGIVGSDVINIFRGEPKACSKKLFSYTNCCSLSGWGKILGARCNAEDKNLVQLRKAKRCVEVGTYCSTRIPLIGCIIKKTVFCCYDSILAKIISQGAKSQLGRSNGTPEGPSCRGLNLDDFKDPRVDLSRLDYSEFYREVIIPNIKIPEVKQTKEGVVNNLPNSGLNETRLKEVEK